MEVTTVYITNIPVIYNGDIEIQIAGVTAEETKKEKFSDDESFKIGSEMQKGIMPQEENDRIEFEFKWGESQEGKSDEQKKRIPFSCCHCEFIGNNTNELRKHKRDMDFISILLGASSNGCPPMLR